MKLVSTVGFDEGQLARLREAAPSVEVTAENARTTHVMGKLLSPDTEILYSFRAPDDLLEKAPNLRWLQLMGAGTDRLENHPADLDSVLITNCSGVGATPIAEHVVCMMLAFSRLLPTVFRAQQNREWLDQDLMTRKIREIRRRTIGIVGYGSIGREVARLIKPFGVTILAVKRNPDMPDEQGYSIENTGDLKGALPDKIFGPDKLHEVLRLSDYVVLAVPLTNETRGMIDAPALAAMKPGSCLINIARGGVVDERALIAALKEGVIAGAALDVFDEEPLPKDSAFWGMENVILTPHYAGSSRPYLRRAFEVLVENLRRYERKEPLLNVIDLARGY